MKCNGIQGISSKLTEEFHLLSIYMNYSRSSGGCNSMQDICAQLTWEGHMKCCGIQCIYA